MANEMKGEPAGRRRGETTERRQQQDAAGRAGGRQATAHAVLVPLDGTRQALAALPVARRIAEIEGATLHLVHAAATALPSVELLGRMGIGGDEMHDLVLNGLAGPAAEGILKAAAERRASWIVMCARTSERPGHRLGRTAERILVEAPCPVVLVPPRRGLVPWDLRRMLLPFDGSPASMAAVRPAARLAASAGASLLALHVETPGAARQIEPGSFTTPRYIDQPQHEWPAWTREFLERAALLGGIPHEIEMSLLLATGDAGEEICRCVAANPIDLVVLAWRGRLEPERAATVKALIREAPCPVLILRV